MYKQSSIIIKNKLVKKSYFLFAVLLGCTCSMAQNTGWKSLFDGKTLKGWHQLNGKAKYEIVNGAIVGTTVAGEPNSFLANDVDYGDFILELELKVGEMNSGIQIRSLSTPEYNNGRVHGYQVEVDPSDRAWSGGIYDEARRGWLYQTEINPAAKKAFNKTGWNKYHIEAIGPVIRTWVNDIPVSYLVDDMTLKGFIALQVHAIKDNKAGAQVMWRNIRIQTGAAMKPRPLDPSTPVVNNLVNQLSDQEKAQGFQLLFDGKDLNGWHLAGTNMIPQNGWQVEEGMIVVPDSTQSRNTGDLISDRQYKAFELNFDFKLTPGANSGVKYFVKETPGNRAGLGLEYQVLDDEKHPDAKMGTLGNRTLASLYDLIPSNKPEPRFQKKIGEWNQGKIVVYPNNHVEHWLNGFKVVEYDRGNNIYKVLVAHSKFAKSKDFGLTETGPILLQAHGDKVFYRNIKIRELK
jgi:hypothetical protein